MNTVQTQRTDTPKAVTPTVLTRAEQNARRRQLRRIKSLKVDFFNKLSRLSDCAEFTKNLRADAHKTLAQIEQLTKEHCRWFDPILTHECDLAIALAALVDGSSA